jgi:hypothetical protein
VTIAIVPPSTHEDFVLNHQHTIEEILMNNQSSSNNSGTHSCPETLDYQTPVLPSTGVFTWTRRIVALICAVGLTALAWQVSQPFLRGPTNNPVATSLRLAPPDVADFYRTSLSPLLDAALERNRLAANRALASLHERFAVHHAGARHFAEDVAGWGTRLGVIGCFASDLWDKHWHGDTSANSVSQYVQQKFLLHVLSEKSLERDVDQVLKQYQDDLETSRNQLYAEMRLPLHGSASPIVLDEAGWKYLCQDINQRVRELSAATPRDTLVAGLASMAGGWVGTEAGEAIVAQILVRVGTAVAVEAADSAAVAGGGAMVGGTATGGSVGSLTSPAGTVIGLGVGLAVGAAIDWWMSERFEVQVIGQCDLFLETVEQKIVDGNKEHPGLRRCLQEALKLADQQQRQAVINALTEARQ